MIKHKHLPPLEKAKVIVKVSNKGFVTNANEYKKGFKRGKSDAMSKKPFGNKCNKITRSFTKGYYNGWRYQSRSARWFNVLGVKRKVNQVKGV